MGNGRLGWGSCGNKGKSRNECLYERSHLSRRKTGICYLVRGMRLWKSVRSVMRAQSRLGFDHGGNNFRGHWKNWHSRGVLKTAWWAQPSGGGGPILRGVEGSNVPHTPNGEEGGPLRDCPFMEKYRRLDVIFNDALWNCFKRLPSSCSESFPQHHADTSSLSI